MKQYVADSDNPAHLDSAIRALSTRRHLPDSHLRRWLGMDPPSKAAFLKLAETLRLRTGQIVIALDQIAEIAARDHLTMAEVLVLPDLVKAQRRRGSAPERARAFLDALRTRRFPRLAQTLERLSRAIGELRLPRGISIILPAELGSEVVTIRLEVARATDLDHAIAVLGDRRGAIVRVLEMLGGCDEV